MHTTFTDNLSCLGLENNLINRKMKKPNIDDYPLMKDGKLQYYNNDLAKYIAFLEAENEQLRLCGVGSSYVVFEDGTSQGVDGLVQLSISLPTIEGARNYARSWKNKELRIYKLIE